VYIPYSTVQTARNIISSPATFAYFICMYKRISVPPQRINLKASSEKSAQSWGKTVRGCFDVEDDMAKGIWSKL